MSNPLTEVAFTSGETNYTFKLGTHAQAVLERRVKMTAAKFFRRKDDEWGVDDLLAVFWAGLNRHHNLTEAQAADLVDDLGQGRVQEIVLEALGIASNKEAVGSSTPPQKAKASGTIS